MRRVRKVGRRPLHQLNARHDGRRVGQCVRTRGREENKAKAPPGESRSKSVHEEGYFVALITIKIAARAVSFAFAGLYLRPMVE